MNCSNISLGYLLIFLNLFIYHSSYTMTSEKCGHHTIYGHEILADLFDRIDFKKCSLFGTKQIKESNNNKKKSSANSKSKECCCIKLILKFFPRKKDPLQKNCIEMLAFFSPSSPDCVEKLNTEK